MKTTGVMGSGIQGHAQSARDLQTDHRCRQKILARSVDKFGRRKRRRYDRCAWVERTVGVRIVEVERMSEASVQEGGGSGSKSPFEAENRTRTVFSHSYPT